MLANLGGSGYGKKLFGGLTLATIVAMSSAALAATVTPVFTDVGIDTSGTAESTRMYRADLTGLGLTEIGAITVNDSNSEEGGSAGIYSGFDLDAIFLDGDGSLATSDDRIFATSFLYSAGSVRGGGTPTSTSGGPFNGASSATSVDEGWATLGDIDGIFFDTGSITLGDGGSLTAVFAPTIPIGPSLYLFAGEVSGDAGETLNGLVEVTDLPPPLTPVPLPAGLPLMLSGLLGLGFLKRRKKVD